MHAAGVAEDGLGDETGEADARVVERFEVGREVGEVAGRSVRRHDTFRDSCAGGSTRRTQSGRVSRARGLSPIEEETASAPTVQPWYASRTAMIVRRPVTVWARRMARSTASLPLFTRKTVSSGSGAELGEPRGEVGELLVVEP